MRSSQQRAADLSFTFKFSRHKVSSDLAILVCSANLKHLAIYVDSAANLYKNVDKPYQQFITVQLSHISSHFLLVFALKKQKLGSTYGPDHDNVGHFWMKSCNFMMETVVFGCLESNAAVIFLQKGLDCLSDRIEFT